MKRKFLLLTMTTILTASLCGCNLRPPAVTGSADDGLWLYKGNARYLSDLSGEEKLIDRLVIGGVSYEDLNVTDTAYGKGNSVHMCLSYPLASDTAAEGNQTDDLNGDSTERVYGGCLVRYDLKEKTTDVLFDGGAEYVVTDIYYADDTQNRFLLYADTGFIIVENGKVAETCKDDFRVIGGYDEPLRYCFTDGGIFRYRSSFSELERRSWDSPEWKAIDGAPDNIKRIAVSGSVLFITTRRKWNDFTYFGLYAYQTETGEIRCLADDRMKEDAQIDPDSGFYLKGEVCTYFTSKDQRICGGNYSLRKFDCATFTEREIAPLDIRNAQWSIYKTTPNSLLLQGDTVEDSSYEYRLYDFTTQSFRAVKLEDFARVSNYIVESEDYVFYYTVKSRGIWSGQYYALHRLRKTDGKDDVMHVAEGYGYMSPYVYDALRNF